MKVPDPLRKIQWRALFRLVRHSLYGVLHRTYTFIRGTWTASRPYRKHLRTQTYAFAQRAARWAEPRLQRLERQMKAGLAALGRLDWKTYGKKAGRGALLLTAATAGALLLYALILFPFTPSADTLRSLKVQQPSVVVSADGEVLTHYRRVNREWVTLDEISPRFKEALLATEDRRFYEHNGIDVQRVVSSVFQTVTGDLQGGSTITQQLARNLFPERIGREITLTRKIKEAITALKIERLYSKEEILETYVNTVPFLYNAFGVEMAAQTYFGKSASELDVLESATLVGMLKGTAYYNPVRNPERARQRRSVVLQQMAETGDLSPDEYHELTAAPIDLDFHPRSGQESRAPHFTERVRRWLSGWADKHGYNIYADSLVVHVTLDSRVQELARRAVQRQAEGLQAVADVEWGEGRLWRRASSPRGYLQYQDDVEPFSYFWQREDEVVNDFIRATRRYKRGVEAGADAEVMLDSLRGMASFMDSLRSVKTRLEAGFVSMNPRNGHVKAWVGSRSFEEEKFDHVAQARRQPGSTFKPFVYATALEEGYSPRDRLRDRHVAIRTASGEVWRPSNASGDVSGRLMTLREGLAHSKNTITAQLIDRVGADDVADMARRLGVRRSELNEVPSLALGTSPVSLLEMTTAYSTLASGGVYHEPVMVTRIEDRNGNVVYEAEPEVETVIDEETAANVVDMMRSVVNDGTGRRIRWNFGIETDVAGKTGTTQRGADGWFMLMHPDLVSGAWVGFNDQRVTFRSSYWGQGAHNALYLVGDFFQQALSHPALGLEQRAPRSRIVRVDDSDDDDVVDKARRFLEGIFGADREREERTRRVRERPTSDMGTREKGETSPEDEQPERSEDRREVRERRQEPVEREDRDAPRQRRSTPRHWSSRDESDRSRNDLSDRGRTSRAPEPSEPAQPEEPEGRPRTW